MVGKVLQCVLVVVLALVACKKPGAAASGGGECSTEGAVTCQGLDTQLVCQGKVWRPYPCHGPGGCTKTEPTGATCDVSNNQAGDTCAKATYGKSFCSGDAKTLLTCVGGQFKTARCDGPKGCKEEKGKATCDESIAAIGSSCTEEGKGACSTDQKNYLVCKNGHRVLDAPCRGKKGCYMDNVRGDKVTCDYSLAYAGDSCPVEQSGDFVGWACSINGGRQMSCNNGKFKYNYKYSCNVCKVEYYEKGGKLPFAVVCD
jgi:hypothetical protein